MTDFNTTKNNIYQIKLKKIEEINPLKKEILELKNSILDLESKFNFFNKDIEKREQRWKNSEKKLIELQKMNEGYVILNVGGSKFYSSLHTLKLKKGTIFYKQIFRKEIQKDKEIFYDRDPTYFPMILNFLKSGKIDIKKLSEDEKEDLLAEAQAFEVNHIVELLKATVAEVEYSKFEYSGEFKHNDIIVGTNNAKHLKDKSLTKGIVSNSPGQITLTLSREVEFEEINIGGYNGNSTAWFVGNGRGAEISTSLNNLDWIIVGNIPAEFGHIIINIKLTKSKAKFIRFNHTDYLGIGYLEVKEKTEEKKR